jgi:hypothetical protein
VSFLLSRLALCRQSLLRYPLPLDQPAHLIILEGFNKRVVEALAENQVEDNEEQECSSSTGQSQALASLTLSPIAKRFKCVGDSEGDCVGQSDGYNDLPPTDEAQRKSNQSQEEADIAHALALSQQDECVEDRQRTPTLADVASDSNHLSQEEADREFAMALSQQLDEEVRVQEEADARLAAKLHAQENNLAPVDIIGGDQQVDDAIVAARLHAEEYRAILSENAINDDHRRASEVFDVRLVQ